MKNGKQINKIIEDLSPFSVDMTMPDRIRPTNIVKLQAGYSQEKVEKNSYSQRRTNASDLRDDESRMFSGMVRYVDLWIDKSSADALKYKGNRNTR